MTFNGINLYQSTITVSDNYLKVHKECYYFLCYNFTSFFWKSLILVTYTLQNTEVEKWSEHRAREMVRIQS